MPSVLITGTSSGLGLATTVELARSGWHVHATMRDLSRRHALDAALADAAAAGQVSISKLDVADPQSIAAAIVPILATPIDAVVHNAGIALGGAFEDILDADIRRVMEINFFGTLELTRQLLPGFRARRQGRIVIISSEAAFAGQPANAIYSASKWALEGWAEAVAYELAPFNIGVVLIEPGHCRTPIWDKSPRLRPPQSPYGPFLDKLYAAANVHVARTARKPIEVARVVKRALEARNPRFRYPVGPLARAGHIVRGKIPSAAFRHGIQRYLGLRGIKL